ncbi:hypothetical protein KVT40_002307 [Elsinoe batatas]|uniref:Uncharacterized protein n=1 Tax=Elsinoe batatas TaxID=2601811 RepID=A0A8K0PKJ6_9PEZI|nr:hypothetical protein KVT40_002307 [Elsinoe batatas]
MNPLAIQPSGMYPLIAYPPLLYNHPGPHIVQPWVPVYSQSVVPASFSVLPQQVLPIGSQPPQTAGYVQQQTRPSAESMPSPRRTIFHTRLTKEEVGRYRPQYRPGWWYLDDAQWYSLSVDNRNSYNKIGLIMETELGQRHTGDDACSRCDEQGWECWGFTRIAVWNVVPHASLRYSRCRGIGKQMQKCSRMNIGRDNYKPEGANQPRIGGRPRGGYRRRSRVAPRNIARRENRDSEARPEVESAGDEESSGDSEA